MFEFAETRVCNWFVIISRKLDFGLVVILYLSVCLKHIYLLILMLNYFIS